MKWTTIQRKINELIPYEHNPRQMTEKQNADLKASLEKFDLVEIPAINTDGTILAGHQRLRLMQTLGRGDEFIDVRIPDRELTPKEVQEYNIRSNKNTGEFNFDVLANSFEVPDLVEWGFIEKDLRINDAVGGWNPEKNFDDEIGDGINDLVGYGLQSFWKDICSEDSELFPHWIELPMQDNQNLIRQKYSRTNLEEIRRVIKTYMRDGDRFFESCCGWSTFSCSAVLHGFSGIGSDIWDTAIEHGRRQYDAIKHIDGVGSYEVIKADAMSLPFSEGEFDFVYCNPPFMDEEKYSGLENDIASKDEAVFSNKFVKLMSENYRILRRDGLCVVTINDKRTNGNLVPLQSKVIAWGQQAGFDLWDFVVAEVLSQKIRLRKKDYEKRRTVKCHEYVIVFKKPASASIRQS